MALDVDGYAVLQAMASAPEAFPDIRAEIPKAARALVVRQLKARGLKPHALRMIRDVIGTEAFALIADGMTDPEVKAVVARLDPHHPTLKQATPGWCRRRLAALAAGEAPVRRGDPAPPERADPPAPAARALGSRPFAATWDGVDHDAPVSAKDKAVPKGAGKKEWKETEKKKKGKKRKD